MKQLSSIKDTEAKKKAKGKAKSKAKSKAQSKAKSKAPLNPKAKAQGKIKANPKAKAQASPKIKSKAKCKAKSEAKSKARSEDENKVRASSSSSTSTLVRRINCDWTVPKYEKTSIQVYDKRSMTVGLKVKAIGRQPFSCSICNSVAGNLAIIVQVAESIEGGMNIDDAQTLFNLLKEQVSVPSCSDLCCK